MKRLGYGLAVVAWAAVLVAILVFAPRAVMFLWGEEAAVIEKNHCSPFRLPTP